MFNAAENAHARELAHEAHTLFLKTIHAVKQGDVAVAMSVSDATISKLKNEHMQPCLTLLAHLGLKLVPSDYACMPIETHKFLVRGHQMVVQKAPHLLFGGDE